jgi:hypothetical protein
VLSDQYRMNSTMTTIASLLYVIGSIFFIPSTGLIVQGTVIFIFGSALLLIGQCLKVIYQGQSVNNGTIQFHLSNYNRDLMALYFDLMVAVGALLFFLGSILFLPTVNRSYIINQIGTTIYVFGAVMFFLSGLILTYQNYTRLNPATDLPYRRL